MNCRDVQRCVHAFIDDELDPRQLLEVEGHLEECEPCHAAVEFERWFKAELQGAVERVSAPPGLGEQVRLSLDRTERSQRLRVLLPQAGFAAALILGVTAALLLPEWLVPTETEYRPIIDYVAERHARSLPLEVSGPNGENVAQWFRGKVDFAVQPPTFPQEQVRLVGGRISHVGDQQAAHLVYDRNGRSITLLVFEDTVGLPFGGIEQQAGSHRVHVGQSRGYNVAVWRQGGVGYAVSSDLAQNDMIRLVSSIR